MLLAASRRRRRDATPTRSATCTGHPAVKTLGTMPCASTATTLARNKNKQNKGEHHSHLERDLWVHKVCRLLLRAEPRRIVVHQIRRGRQHAVVVRYPDTDIGNDQV